MNQKSHRNLSPWKFSLETSPPRNVLSTLLKEYGPQDFCLMVFTPFLQVQGEMWLILTHRTQQSNEKSFLWWRCIRLYHPLCKETLPCWLCWARRPCWELLCGEGHVAGNRGQPLAYSQQETEALSPATHKDLNPANNHVKSKVDASPVELSVRPTLWLQPCRELSQATLGLWAQRNHEIINLCRFGLLSVWQNCYAAVDTTLGSAKAWEGRASVS